MNALIFDHPGNYNEVLNLIDIAKQILQSGKVRVAVKARPINPSDIFFMKGMYRKKPNFPQIAGLEGSGLILECAHNVKGFSIGDHVAFRTVGTWADEIVVDHQELIKINANLPFDVSCMIPLNGLTAYALLDESKAKEGDFLLLNAANSYLCKLIIQIACAKGIRVLAIVREIDPSEELLKLGCEVVFRDADPDLWNKLKDLTANRGIQSILDALGGDMVSNAIPLMSQFGNVIIYGNMRPGLEAAFSNKDVIYRNLRILGFGIDRWMSQKSSSEIADYYNDLVNKLANADVSFPQTDKIQLNQVMDYKLSEKKTIII